ncbi:MAG: hypothetical protein IPM29_27845 [Planctomycetes bacterium]|nr:hypothetical protein [Planctomycetota bacterium]
MRRSLGAAAVVLTVAGVGAAQERSLRDTIVRASLDREWFEPLTWLREHRPPVAALVDALVDPPDLPVRRVRQLTARLAQSLDGFGAELGRLWCDEPEKRAARAAAFAMFGPEWLARTWGSGGAAERGDVERVAALGDPDDFAQLRRLACGAGRPELAVAARRLAEVVSRAPHAVDALDVGLLARLDRDPGLVERQDTLRDALLRDGRDALAWSRYRVLLEDPDPRVRARGAFLVRGTGSVPSLGVLAAWAVDPFVPWPHVSLSLDDATVIRAIAPAIRARGAAGIHRVLLPQVGGLPPLSTTARDALGDALVTVLLTEGAPLDGTQRRAVGHGIDDRASAERAVAAGLLGELGLGARALHEARRLDRTEALLAVLDRGARVADAADVDDLRGLWSHADAAVRAGVAELLTRRTDVPADLRAAVGERALEVVRTRVGELTFAPQRFGTNELAEPSDPWEVPAARTGLPATPDARLVLAACALGAVGLFEPLLAELERHPPSFAPDDPDDGAHAALVTRALGRLGPWLDGARAGRLFDVLATRIDAMLAGDRTVNSWNPMPNVHLEAVGGLLTTLPEDHLVELGRLLAAPGGAEIWGRLSERGPPVPRRRALWLLETWAGRSSTPLRLYRAVPERFAVEWRSGEAMLDPVSHLRYLCESDPDLVVAWRDIGFLPAELLAAGMVGVAAPSPELLARVAEAPTDRSWSSRWFDTVRRLDPAAHRPQLERIARSPDHRFAVAAAEALWRGDADSAALGLRRLEELAGSDIEAVRIKGLERCAAVGVTSPAVLDAARTASRSDGYLALVGMAVLVGAAELTDEDVRALGASRADFVLRLARSGIGPGRRRDEMDALIAEQAQQFEHQAPALQAGMLDAAAGNIREIFLLSDHALAATASGDAALRRAAYRLLAGADPVLFPTSVLAGEAALDDDADVRAVAPR